MAGELESALSGIVEMLNKSGSQMGTAIGGMATSLGSLGPVLGAVKEAISTVVTSLLTIPNAVRPFVDAFSPVTMLAFDQQVRNLSATIGQAFAPAISFFTAAISKVADILGPAFEALAGPMTALAEIFTAALMPIFRYISDQFVRFAGVLSYLMPLFAALGKIVAAVGEVVRSVQAVIWAVAGAVFSAVKPLVDLFMAWVGYVAQLMESTSVLMKVWEVLAVAFYEFIGSILGWLAKWLGGASYLTDGVNMLTKAVRDATIGIVLWTARILKFFGFDALLKKMREAYDVTLGGTKKVAAPTDLGITGIEDIIRESTLLAAAATGAGAPKSTEETLEDMYKLLQDQIRDVEKNGVRFDGSLKQIIDLLDGLPVKIAYAIISAPVRLPLNFITGDDKKK